ncbi:MAG: hypothetical protein ACYTAO_02175 [Planctomycetota bacterium]|jgi:hypothetical protein
MSKDLDSVLGELAQSLVREDSTLDGAAVLRAIRGVLSPEQYERLEEGLVKHFAPSGVEPSLFSSWDSPAFGALRERHELAPQVMDLSSQVCAHLVLEGMLDLPQALRTLLWIHLRL